MNWWLVLFVLFFGIGLIGTGSILAYRIYRNPILLVSLLMIWWENLKPVLIKKVLPLVLRLFRRMDPETEAAWRECERRGGKWNAFKKKCE